MVTWLLKNASWVPSVIGGLSAVAAAFSWAMVGDPPNQDWRALWFGVVFTAISLLIGILLEVWRHQSRAAERGEASRARILLTDAFDPIVNDLARMPSKPKRVRETALVKIVSNACASLPVALPDGKNLRVIVYKIQESSTGVRQLVSMNHIGRSDKPGRLVDKPGERGEAIFKMIAEGTSLFVGDIAKIDMVGVESAGKRYRTFISSPIIADDQAFGMLSVDSPSVGSLDENDIAILEFFAALISVAFAEAARRT